MSLAASKTSWRAALAIGASILGILAVAAPNPGTPKVTLTGGFSVPINEGNQTVALVSGKEARPALPGQFTVIQFRLETFRYDPDRKSELIIESPSGVFDPAGAASVEPISLSSADSRFAVTGKGWHWDRASGLLVISNAVQTTMRRPGSPADAPPIGIQAQRLEYNVKSGETRFLGECVAEEVGRARLRAGELSSVLGVRGERPDSISATNGVVIEMLRPGHEGRATGSGANYTMTPEGERIDLLGSATWDFGPGMGQAGELVLFPGRETYSARGSARMVLRSSLRPSTRGEAPPPLEITSSTMEAKPGEIVFTGPVVARQGQQLDLNASRLVAVLSTNAGAVLGPVALQGLTATGDVTAHVLAAGVPVEVRGQEMIYAAGVRPTIEVTGQPTWKTEGYQGRATRFVIDTELPAFDASDDVHVTWMDKAPGNSAPVPIELHAGRMRVERGNARFSDKVAVRQDSWDLHASEMDLTLSSNAAPREIHAVGDVVLVYRAPLLRGVAEGGPANVFAAFASDASAPAREWTIRTEELGAVLDPDGRGIVDMESSGGVRIEHAAVKAEGEHAIYDRRDGRMRLKGDAQLHTAEGLEILGERETALGMDLVAGRFFVEGPVRKMRFPARAVGGRAAAWPKPDLR